MPESTELQPPAVVLVRPRHSGNIGSAARAMANMGLDRLLVVKPATPIDGEARMFGVGADRILETAERVATFRQAIAPFERVVGTTSSRDRAPGARLATARELPALLARDGSPAGDAVPTALVFGPEVSGLRNDELALCSPLVRIPTGNQQPTLNLAQAVLVVAYELFVATPEPSAPEPPLAGDPAASAGEVNGLFGHLTPLLERVGFARDDSFDGVLSDLRRLAARARPTPREVSILRGICRRMEHSLARTSPEAE